MWAGLSRYPPSSQAIKDKTMWKICCASLALLFCVAAQAEAHFGMVIPSTATVTEKKDADLKLDISFSHPMEMQGMDMAAPKAFTVTRRPQGKPQARHRHGP